MDERDPKAGPPAQRLRLRLLAACAAILSPPPLVQLLFPPHGKAGGKGDMLDIAVSLHSRTAPASPFDYVIDGQGGSDGNDGSASAPFATIGRLSAVAAAAPSTPFSALIRAGTYGGGQAFTPGSGASATFTLVFEPGCRMEQTEGLASGPNAIETNGAAHVVVRGNGLVIAGYDSTNGGAYANGLSAASSGRLEAYDVEVRRCGDGISCHAASHGDFTRVTAADCVKSAYFHVGSAQTTHTDCAFTGRAGATGGIGGIDSATGAGGHFLRCAFTPANAGQLMSVTTALDCTVGSFTLPVDASGLSFTDSFVHVLNTITPPAHAQLYTRCYGFVSIRHRDGGGRRTLRNCILGGAAKSGSQAAQGLAFRNAAFPASSPLTIEDTVLTGYTVAIGNQMNAASAQQLVDAGLVLGPLAFFANTTDIDADIAAATGYVPPPTVVTANPLPGPMNSTARSAWGLAAGSPCLGAGTGGGHIGFAAAA